MAVDRTTADTAERLTRWLMGDFTPDDIAWIRAGLIESVLDNPDRPLADALGLNWRVKVLFFQGARDHSLQRAYDAHGGTPTAFAERIRAFNGRRYSRQPADTVDRELWAAHRAQSFYTAAPLPGSRAQLYRILDLNPEEPDVTVANAASECEAPE